MSAYLIPRLFRKMFRNEHYTETLNFFRGIPIFQGLTKRQLGRIMLTLQRRSYQAGERLFEEGQIGKAVFIIKSGKVELSRRIGQKERVLDVLGAGHMFGEMALLEQMKRTATASVIEDGEVFLLYTSTLETLIRDYPDIGVQLLRNMAILLSALLRRANYELDHYIQEDEAMPRMVG